MPEVTTAAAAEQPIEPAPDSVLPSATCLGCGCACDDIEVVVGGAVRSAATSAVTSAGAGVVGGVVGGGVGGGVGRVLSGAVAGGEPRIIETRNACALGAAWFGDGRVPARAYASGRETTVAAALDAAAAMLAGAQRPLVYLAPDISSEAQREAIAIADLLRGRIDSVTSATVLASILAAQERGRAGATLGEIRNRADVILFWGVDPLLRYPRFPGRYAPEPAGLQIPGGRSARTVIAVDIDDMRGPDDADIRVAVPAAIEVATLILLTALAAEPPGSAASGQPTPAIERPHDPAAVARNLLPALLAAKYLSIVADAEPPAVAKGLDAAEPAGQAAAAAATLAGGLSRASALIALAQALNGPTRCALTTLRAGGNRSGADAALTSQTGYPAAVDFSRGYPRYRPYESGRLAADIDAVLVVGALALVPAPVRELVERGPAAIIGPRASDEPPPRAEAVIDAGTAGIHCGGTAMRMDDVPLPLRPMLPGPPDPAVLIHGLRDRLFLLPLGAARP